MSQKVKMHAKNVNNEYVQVHPETTASQVMMDNGKSLDQAVKDGSITQSAISLPTVSIYVDNVNGNDANSGETSDQAIRTIQELNKRLELKIIKGDTASIGSGITPIRILLSPGVHEGPLFISSTLGRVWVQGIDVNSQAIINNARDLSLSAVNAIESGNVTLSNITTTLVDSSYVAAIIRAHGCTIDLDNTTVVYNPNVGHSYGLLINDAAYGRFNGLTFEGFPEGSSVIWSAYNSNILLTAPITVVGAEKVSFYLHNNTTFSAWGVDISNIILNEFGSLNVEKINNSMIAESGENEHGKYTLYGDGRAVVEYYNYSVPVDTLSDIEFGTSGNRFSLNFPILFTRITSASLTGSVGTLTGAKYTDAYLSMGTVNNYRIFFFIDDLQGGSSPRGFRPEIDAIGSLSYRIEGYWK